MVFIERLFTRNMTLVHLVTNKQTLHHVDIKGSYWGCATLLKTNWEKKGPGNKSPFLPRVHLEIIPG